MLSKEEHEIHLVVIHVIITLCLYSYKQACKSLHLLLHSTVAAPSKTVAVVVVVVVAVAAAFIAVIVV